MLKFKPGDRVVLIQYETDAESNLKIGYTGIVQEVMATAHEDGNQVKVLWDKWSMVRQWWVHPLAIEFENVCLENK